MEKINESKSSEERLIFELEKYKIQNEEKIKVISRNFEEKKNYFEE